LSRNAIIPTTLSTADDVSVALHIAVSGPKINWYSAELVLERFLFLWNEEPCVLMDDDIDYSVLGYNV
jgi:hypothetical protein